MPAIAFRLPLPVRPRASRTLRVRLTLLYGGLFLLCGTALLTITYLLVAHAPQITQVTVGDGATAPPELAFDPGGLRAYAQAQAAAAHAAELNQLLVMSGIALLAMVVVSVLLGWWMAGRALQPVREMTGKARRLSEANLHERLAVAGPDDELKELGDTFDGLLARLDAAFEAQKRFVANASHELRTPLTFQRAVLEVVLADRHADAAQLRAACERALAAGADQERLIEALLTLARGQRGLERREPVDLAAMTSRVVAHQDPALPEDARVSVDGALAPARTWGDVRLLERLVGNLVDNAIRHNVPGGWVAVWTGTDGDQAMLRVVNSGPVVAPDQIGVLVQPFQRMDSRINRRDGLGLGLSIVAAIAGAHGAHLAIEARPDGGLEVTLAFPAVPSDAVPSNAVPSNAVSAATALSANGRPAGVAAAGSAVPSGR
jgi:signal transduction histidine kinase